jgi:hypothetical protein
MKNPPAFQFYPQDFISDLNVLSMTDDEVGKYTKLLCSCWIEDGLKIGSPMVELWFNQHPILARCFIKKGGKYRNPRLDRERDKQKKWSEKSSLGGSQRVKNKEIAINGSTKRQPSPNQGPSLQSLSSSFIKKEEKNKSFSPLADFLRDRIQLNVPFQKIPVNYQESWGNEFRLMVESDRIPIERIRAVLEWATQDSFWKVNIRSGSKFREQFGVLEAKSRSVREDPRNIEVEKSKRVGAGPAKTPEQKTKAQERDRRVKEYVKQQEAKWDPLIDAAKNEAERDHLRVAANTETEAGIEKLYGYEGRS